MTAPPTPENFQSSTDTNGVNLDWNYNVTWFAFDGDDNTLGGFDEGIWLHPDNGIKVYYRQKGATTWNEFSEVSIDDESESVTGLNSDTTYEFKIRVYTSNEYSETGIVEATTFLNTSRSVTSHINAISSSVSSIIDLSYGISSHSNQINSSASRLISLKRTPLSHSNNITSTSDRGGADYENRTTDISYSNPITSFVYNKRTSLELIDHTIEWKDNKAVWYTDWFQETRILGNEDQLAIRSLVVDDAKDPAAKVKIQYDAIGNGSVDYESDVVELGRDQSIKKVSGVPIDEEGYYRIKIMEYSGYNSLYALDTAIIH
jgi:hypothetical protein